MSFIKFRFLHLLVLLDSELYSLPYKCLDLVLGLSIAVFYTVLYSAALVNERMRGWF